MATQTTAEIRNQAAKKLGLFPTGGTLRSAISDDLDNAYLEVFETCQSKGIATWGVAGTAVPNSFVEPLVSWVAGIRVDQYSVPSEKYQRIMLDYRGGSGMGSAEDRLRAAQSNPKHGPTKIEYF